EEVTAGEQGRDGLALDRRRLFIAERGDRRQQARVELEGSETIGGGLGGVNGRGGHGRRAVGDRDRLVGFAFRHVGHCRRVGGAQRAPAIGSRSIVRTRRVPPPSVPP